MDADPEKKKHRTRSIIWFNPPFSSNVKTNIGKVFLRILRKHFPPSSDLYKLFNSKKVKLSYSCCPSMKNIISSHNAKITREKEMVAARSCNCRGGVVSCPLGGKCLTACLVYKATVTTAGREKSYLGQAASTFKLRYNNHKSSFTNDAAKHSTALSTYVSALRRNEADYNIKWSIESTPAPYRGGGGSCMLCLVEKTLIARSDRRVSLNRRTEIMSKCRHRMPYYLINYHGLHVPPDPDPLPPNLHDLLPEEPDPLPTPQQPGPVPAHPDHQHGADPLPIPCQIILTISMELLTALAAFPVDL